jgi:hypothetical protein
MARFGMSPSPRLSIDDHFTDGKTCAVCGATGLHVKHAAGYPDYVACDACGSAFVLEAAGDRVLYGNIPAAYPAARNLALRNWVTLEAVARAPLDAQPAAEAGVVAVPPEPEPSGEDLLVARLGTGAVPLSDEPEPGESPPAPEWSATAEQPDWTGAAQPSTPEPKETLAEPEAPPSSREEPAPLKRLARLMTSEEQQAPAIGPQGELILPEGFTLEEPAASAPPSPEVVAPSPAAAPVARPTPAAVAAPAGAAAALLQPTEPPPGQRYRVVIRGSQVVFPRSACAHCGRIPASGRIAFAGFLPKGQAMGQRRPVAFRIPVCRPCQRRAAARIPEEKTARLQAHLISALVGMVMIVLAMAVNLVSPSQESVLLVLLPVVVLFGLGYAIAAVFLLGRTRRYPLPADAVYVRTTLLMPSDIQGLESAFEWRNRDYAERFQQANKSRALGGVVPVKDRELEASA